MPVLMQKEKTWSTNREIYLRNVEMTAAKIINLGEDAVEDAIAIIGRIISRSECIDTIIACEKLIEILNDGPQIRSINQLSEDQASFSANLLTSTFLCVNATVC